MRSKLFHCLLGSLAETDLPRCLSWLSCPALAARCRVAVQPERRPRIQRQVQGERAAAEHGAPDAQAAGPAQQVRTHAEVFVLYNALCSACSQAAGWGPAGEASDRKVICSYVLYRAA